MFHTEDIYNIIYPPLLQIFCLMYIILKYMLFCVYCKLPTNKDILRSPGFTLYQIFDCNKNEFLILIICF